MNNEFWATIESVKQIAKETYEVSFSCTVPFTFVPGQYIWVVLPKLNYPDIRGNRRAFSIVSSTTTPNILTILFRSGTSGYKKTLLGLNKNERVLIYGPFGSAFTVSKDIKTQLIMISGGVGIAPFLGILNSVASLEYKPPLTLVNFNSNPEKQILPSELARLCSEGNVSLIDKVGSAKLKSVFDISKIKDAIFFICGPQPMVDTIYLELKSYGIPDEQMVFEEVYPCSTRNINL